MLTNQYFLRYVFLFIALIANSQANTVEIRIENILTYIDPTSPLVSDTFVSVRDGNLVEVAQGSSGTTGVATVSELPAGTYEVTVNAAGHEPSRLSVTSIDGQTNSYTVFLIQQSLWYQTSVVPTVIKEETSISFGLDHHGQALRPRLEPIIAFRSEWLFNFFRRTTENIVNPGWCSAFDVSLEEVVNPGIILEDPSEPFWPISVHELNGRSKWIAQSQNVQIDPSLNNQGFYKLKYHTGTGAQRQEHDQLIFVTPLRISCLEMDANLPSDEPMNVALELESRGTLSRSETGYRVSLSLFNDSGADASALSASLSLKDGMGADITDSFLIGNPEFSQANGTLLGDGSTLTITYLVRPRIENVPSAIRPTFSFQYDLDGSTSNRATLPDSLLLEENPEPALESRIIVERSLWGDWLGSFEEEFIADKPEYRISTLFRNSGQAVLKNLRYIYTQPEITTNENGLLTEMRLVATQVGNGELESQITQDIGDLGLGQTVLMEALYESLSGAVISPAGGSFGLMNDFSADQTQESALESMQVLSSLGRVSDPRPSSAARMGFLIDHDAPVENLPDQIYFDDWAVEDIISIRHEVNSLTLSNLTATLPVNAPPPGYTYFDIADPSEGAHQLLQIERSDGRILTLGEHFWITEYTDQPDGSRIEERRIHFFDWAPTSSYVLRFQNTPPLDQHAPASKVLELPIIVPEAAIEVSWDSLGSDDIASYEIYVIGAAGIDPVLIHTATEPGSKVLSFPGHQLFSIAIDKAGNRERQNHNSRRHESDWYDAETWVQTTLNLAPVIESIPSPLEASEGQLFSFRPSASDPNGCLEITWEFGGAVPEGMTIDTHSGEVQWTPGEGTGGQTVSVPIVARDSHEPFPTSSATLNIDVLATNTPPVLPVGSITVLEGRQLDWQVTATDSDLPAQALTFQDLSGSGSGPSLTKSGRLQWNVPLAGKEETLVFPFAVSDDGSPPLTTSGNLRIRVLTLDKLSGSLSIDQNDGGNYEIIGGEWPLHDYELYFSPDLGTWTPLETIRANPDGSLGTKVEASELPVDKGFFRLRVD